MLQHTRTQSIDALFNCTTSPGRIIQIDEHAIFACCSTPFAQPACCLCRLGMAQAIMSGPWMAVGVVGEEGAVEERRVIEGLLDYGPWVGGPGVRQSRARYIKYRYEHRYMKPRPNPQGLLQPARQVGRCFYTSSKWQLDGLELASQL